MRNTNIFEKAMTSLFNVFLIGIVSVPVWWTPWDILTKKLFVIGLFLAYNIIFLLFKRNRDLGMMLIGTHWEKEYPLKNQFVFLILYTLSFSTLFFWILFPFDLFLFNMLVLQLPLILKKDTTLHGYLSGKMVTVKTHKIYIL